MDDYQPMSLAGLCNVGVDFAPSIKHLVIGKQLYHGLPFLIGAEEPDPARCFVGFGGDAATEPVTVPIGQTARHLIVAHTLIESGIFAGEPVGRVVAHYCICYADGGELRVPIRDRFEIGLVPTQWGHLAFLARPDHADGMLPRKAGSWDTMGERHTEVDTGWPKNYYLWTWRNPDPERLIAALRFEPAGSKMLVAAVTLGHLDELPFNRAAKREVLITLPLAEDAAKPFDLAVDVDRGAATYPYALPSSADAFLDDPLKGFGEAQNEAASPAYVEVAASPSATVTIKQADEELGRVRWGELEAEGTIETPRVRLEVVDRGRNWVDVTVLDDDTGHPVPCRVHFRSPEGIPYQPHGHHQHVNSNLDSWHVDIGGDPRLGQITYAYIDGRCQGWLPRGEVIVDVARGFEYEPLRAKVRIEPGQRELTLRLKRWTDQNAGAGSAATRMCILVGKARQGSDQYHAAGEQDGTCAVPNEQRRLTHVLNL